MNMKFGHIRVSTSGKNKKQPKPCYIRFKLFLVNMVICDNLILPLRTFLEVLVVKLKKMYKEVSHDTVFRLHNTI